MKTSVQKETIEIAGTEVSRSCHACAFFNSRDEYYEVLMPFIKNGLVAGDKTLHIIDVNHHENHLRRLTDENLPMDHYKSSGQFELKGWEDSYLKPGHFSQDAMLDLVAEVLEEAKTKGYPMARLVGNMEWACQHDVPGVKDIVKYETRLNHFLKNYNAVVLCTYDLSKHSATVVMDILRTHPYVLIGGTMHENPYYVSPVEFLSELESREQSLELQN